MSLVEFTTSSGKSTRTDPAISLKNKNSINTIFVMDLFYEQILPANLLTSEADILDGRIVTIAVQLDHSVS